MLKDLWRFLVLLEAAIPPGEGQHHNFSLYDSKRPTYAYGNLTLWLMMGEEYIPITFEPSDELLSPEQLVSNIFNIPHIRERLKK